jgi:acetyl-CoA carboxylase biotin carboxyl carrier protein
VRSIIEAAESSDVYELEVESGGLRVSLRRTRDPDGASTAVSTTVAEPTSLGIPPGWHVVEAPLTGIWYDASAPGAAPYVSIGEEVAAGAIVGLVETMKVFNEVNTDVAGRVRQLFVGRGDLVSAHAPLVAIEPTATAMSAPEDGA